MASSVPGGIVGVLHERKRAAILENNSLSLDGKVLAVIEATFMQTGFAPSVAEVAEALGMSKGGTLSDSLKRLEAAGSITYQAARKYFIPSNWRELAGGSTIGAAELEDSYNAGYSAGIEAGKETGLIAIPIVSGADLDIEAIRREAYAAGIEAEKQRVRDLTNARLERLREKKKRARG